MMGQGYHKRDAIHPPLANSGAHTECFNSCASATTNPTAATVAAPANGSATAPTGRATTETTWDRDAAASTCADEDCC